MTSIEERLTFAHDLTNVYQNQSYFDIESPKKNTNSALREHVLGGTNGIEPYNLELDDRRRWDDLGVEQR